MTIGYYFKVLNKDNSIAVQKHLFSLGYSWVGQKQEPSFTAAPILVTDSDSLTLMFANEEDYLKVEGYTEGFIDDGVIKVKVSISEVVRSAVAIRMKNILITLAEKVSSAPLTDEVIGELKVLNDFLKNNR